jgi:hypothetical protein
VTRIDPIRYARGVFERVNRWVPINGHWSYQRKLQKARTLIVLANVFCSQLFHVSQLCRANVERRHLDRSRALQEATDKRRVVGLDKTRLEKKEGIVTELGGAAPRTPVSAGDSPSPGHLGQRGGMGSSSAGTTSAITDRAALVGIATYGDSPRQAEKESVLLNQHRLLGEDTRHRALR